MSINVKNLDTIQVIVKAIHIDEDTLVSKTRTGTKYVLKRSIKIYAENRKEIKCDDGHIFLVDRLGNVNMISEDTDLFVNVKIADLYQDLYDELCKDEDK